MNARALLPACLALATSSACLVGDVLDIPCASDDECPTSSFCDLTGGVCILGAKDGLPPNVNILGVEGEDGKVRTFTNVAVDVDTTVTLHMTNDGGYVAEDIEIELSDLWCAPMSIDEDTLPARLDGGETAEVTLRMNVLRTCANPVPVDWFVDFSGRQHRGVFELFHEAEQSNDYPDQD